MKVTWNDASQWCVELHFGDECRALDVGTARAFYAQLDDVLREHGVLAPGQPGESIGDFGDPTEPPYPAEGE